MSAPYFVSNLGKIPTPGPITFPTLLEFSVLTPAKVVLTHKPLKSKLVSLGLQLICR